jgi:enoyl-CoA hydratase
VRSVERRSGVAVSPGPTVLSERTAEHVVTLTLNRPDKLNAINREMIGAIVEAVEVAGADDTARVVVLKGSGRSFSAGADASTHGVTRIESASENRADYLDGGWGRFLRIFDLPIPVIAQVHGHCLGIATVLCNMVDLVVVSEDAEIGWPALPMGGGVISPTWVYFVGARKAKEFSFMTGSRLTGAEAVELGWANRAVPGDELDATVASMAERIARTPRGLLRLKKEAINRIVEQMGFRDTVRLGASWGALSHTDPGAHEVMEVVREVGLKEAIEHYRR